MKNKVVFITGVACGIGFEIRKQFAEKGATVIISDINDKKVFAAASILKNQDLEVTGIGCDVTMKKN